MASKYAKFVKDMERAKPEDGKWQARVDEAKVQIKRNGITSAEQLARRWRRLRGIMERFEARRGKINLALEATFQLMTETFEASGISKLAFAEGGAVGTQPEIYVSVQVPGMLEELVKSGVPEKDAKELVAARKREIVREWCKANGHEGDLTLNPQTMASLFKEMLLEGIPLPEFVKMTSGSSAKLYKD